jgi:hypothetical protein
MQMRFATMRRWAVGYAPCWTQGGSGEDDASDDILLGSLVMEIHRNVVNVIDLLKNIDTEPRAVSFILL